MKKGPLTESEKRDLEALCLKEGLTDEQIAKKLGRHVNTIVSNRKKLGIHKGYRGVITEDSQQQVFNKKSIAKGKMSDRERFETWKAYLKTTGRYEKLERSLTKEQLNQFIELWCNYHTDLEDMNALEEDMVERMIMLQFRMDDNQKSTKDIAVIEAQIVAQLSGRNTEELDLESESDRHLWEMIQSNNRMKLDLNKDYKDLVDRYEKVQKSLNATREQRESRKQIGGNTFISLVKQFNERDQREEVGKYNELMRLSGENQIKKLKKPHEFQDGNIEPIIMDGSDFVKKEKNA